jgi:hypothetical protein
MLYQHLSINNFTIRDKELDIIVLYNAVTASCLTTILSYGNKELDIIVLDKAVTASCLSTILS